MATMSKVSKARTGLQLEEKKPKRRAPESIWATPEPEDYARPVIKHYQRFVARTRGSGQHSNSISLWDLLPKYGIPLNQQEAMRNERGDLPDYERPFEYDGQRNTLVVRAARIKGPDGLGYDVYPSEREQVVESALRYLACQQAKGFYTRRTNAPTPVGGVVFTIHEIRKLLAEHGRHYRPREIREAIEVMRYAGIGVRGERDRRRVIGYTSILSGYGQVLEPGEAEASDSAQWYVVFNSAICRAIETRDYRQYEFRQMVRCRSPLSRWLYLALIHRWTNVSPLNPMRITLLEVQRDSGFLRHKALPRCAQTLEKALGELAEGGVLSRFEIHKERAGRGRLIDAIYTLHATSDFRGEVICANKRAKLADER